MTIRVEAIVENGLLRPLERMPLYDQERVTLTIYPHDEDLDHEYLAQCQAAHAERGEEALSVKEIRELLKDLPGSFADAIIEDRGDR